jgi:hypothetical protein
MDGVLMFGIVEKIIALLETQGLVVNDSIQDLNAYTSGSALVFVGDNCEVEYDETVAMCVKEKVSITIEIYGYETTEIVGQITTVKSKVDNLKTAYQKVVKALYAWKGGNGSVENFKLENGKFSLTSSLTGRYCGTYIEYTFTHINILA